MNVTQNSHVLRIAQGPGGPSQWIEDHSLETGGEACEGAICCFLKVTYTFWVSPYRTSQLKVHLAMLGHYHSITSCKDTHLLLHCEPLGPTWRRAFLGGGGPHQEG